MFDDQEVMKKSHAPAAQPLALASDDELVAAVHEIRAARYAIEEAQTRVLRELLARWSPSDGSP